MSTLRLDGPVHYAETPLGFEFGSAKVERQFHYDREGHGSGVAIGLTTPKHDVQVYASGTGKVRVFVDGTEWRRP